MTADDQTPPIIIPPPEIRVIVDKTAAFVGKRDATELEATIRAREADNPKFCFLRPNDPYHPYYRQKLNEAKQSTTQSQPTEAKLEDSYYAQLQQPQSQEAAMKVPTEPPAFEFSAQMPQMDIIKLTALFVARNGRQFMSQLQQREQNNFQFDFLKPQHSFYSFFTKLVEQYTKILVPSKELLGRLDELDDQEMILKECADRADWLMYQRENKKKRDKEEEKERVAFLSIDWHDFVVVQTVEFTPADDAIALPQPMTKTQLESLSLVERQKLIGVVAPNPVQPTPEEDEAEMDIE